MVAAHRVSVECAVVLVYTNDSRVYIIIMVQKRRRSLLAWAPTELLRLELSSLTHFPYMQVDYNFRLL